MEFQVFSDTHFELRKMKPFHINKYADNLILAGDISASWHTSLYEFLDFASKTWNHVFYIPGNHEFYCFDRNYVGDFREIERNYRQEIKKRYENVYYLNNNTVWFDGEKIYNEPIPKAICIIGSTLWSSPHSGIEVEINDFYVIYTKDDNALYDGSSDSKVIPMTAAYMGLENEFSIQYIKNKLEKNKDYFGNDAKTIVITHFPPVRGGTSSQQHVGEDEIIKSYYANKLDDFIKENPQINWWVFGHTHHAAIIEKYQTKLLTNAIGYPTEKIKRRTIDSYFKNRSDIYSCVFEI